MAIVSNPRTIELEDIQAMAVWGRGDLPRTAYFLLKVEELAKAKVWIKSVLSQVDSAEPTVRTDGPCHLAFTATGLRALGLSSKNVDKFPIPFREGISTENRNRILGDYGRNAPENWRWGGNDKSLHILLICHAKDDAALDVIVQAQQALVRLNGGLTLLQEMRGFLRPDNKEPFGFHDAISQPTVKGSGRSGSANDVIETGEFLLGYKNEYGVYPYSPLIGEEQGNLSLLPEDAAGSGKKDLGRNGSFMVYRQMAQYVDYFWDFMKEKSKNADGTLNEEAMTKLAAKCVGRWPGGASLVNFPDADPGGSWEKGAFGYAEKDPHGFHCPYGSHVRRNNPRDNVRWYDAEQSLKITRRHRILRRGRNYEMIAGTEGATTNEVGLQFICFNTDLELQFEFMQHAWANNPQLRYLTNDPDVLIGVPAEGDPNAASSQFTIQAEPTNQFVDGLRPFTSIKGGEYFFFPGISALHYLTTI